MGEHEDWWGPSAPEDTPEPVGEHTPGPWEAIGWEVHAAEEERCYIGAVTSADTGGDEAFANARLIAAAPDLLEAAKAAQQWLAHGNPDNLEAVADIEQELRAAIAKATH